MKHDELVQRLHDEMRCVSVSPALRRRTLDAMQGKEGKIVKKKLSAALVMALLVTLLCTAALAAAAHWGMTDFWNQYDSNYVPEDAAEHFQTDVHRLETNHVVISMRELYYDGVSAYATVDVAPKEQGLLLIPSYMSMTADLWEDLTRKPGTSEESQAMTLLEAWQQYGYTDAMQVAIGMVTEEDGQSRNTASSVDAVLNEDGTLTFSVAAQYEKNVQQREGMVNLVFTRYENPEQGEAGLQDEMLMQMTLNVHLAAQQTGRRYVSTEPQLYESVGVRVERIIMDVQPLNIYATIEFTVVDEALYKATEDGLWFEFIDPDSEETSHVLQRLQAGVDTGGSIDQVNANLYMQTETLGVNELRDVYTLRAYNCWDKTRYETCEFVMAAE